MAYFEVHSRAVLSCLALSVFKSWAISGTSGSSGLGSVNREQMESKTLLMVTHDQTAIHQCTHCAICIDGNVQFDDDHTSAPAVLQVESLSIGATYPTSPWDEDPKEEA